MHASSGSTQMRIIVKHRSICHDRANVSYEFCKQKSGSDCFANVLTRKTAKEINNLPPFLNTKLVIQSNKESTKKLAFYYHLNLRTSGI